MKYTDHDVSFTFSIMKPDEQDWIYNLMKRLTCVSEEEQKEIEEELKELEDQTNKEG